MFVDDFLNQDLKGWSEAIALLFFGEIPPTAIRFALPGIAEIPHPDVEFESIYIGYQRCCGVAV